MVLNKVDMNTIDQYDGYASGYYYYGRKIEHSRVTALEIAVWCNALASERWYLVYALPNNERKAEFHLGSQGFRTYLPQVQKTIRHARQLRTVRAPLFPRYLFVHLDLDRDRWLSVRSTIGVARLFTQHDGRPVPVPIGIVETLLARSVGNLVRLDAGLVVGQCVRVLSGPFAELRARLSGSMILVAYEFCSS